MKERWFGGEFVLGRVADLADVGFLSRAAPSELDLP